MHRQPKFSAAFWIIIERCPHIHPGPLITKLLGSEGLCWVDQMIMAMHGEHRTGLEVSLLAVSAFMRRAEGLPVAKI